MNVEHHRQRLIHIAQGITGNYSDAEDIVSEAILKFSMATDIETPEAWLTKVVVHSSIDFLRSSRVKRERYIGPWLPEAALVTGNIEQSVLRTEEVDLAIQRLLQEIDPMDRALVVLHDVAGMTHPELSQMLNISTEACRQRLVRAHRKLHSNSEQGAASARMEQSVRKIHQSLNRGDLDTLVDLLSEGAVLWTDANGKQKAARNPIVGKEKVARFIRGIIARYGMPTWDIIRIHGAWSLLGLSADMVRVVTFEFTGGEVTGIQVQQEQHKMRGITPCAPE